MNPDVHKKSDLYCPFCLLQLTEVITSGHLFCPTPSPDICEYEAPNGQNENYPPLSHKQALQRKLWKAESAAAKHRMKAEELDTEAAKIRHSLCSDEYATNDTLNLTYKEHAALLHESRHHNYLQVNFGPEGARLADTHKNQWAIDRLKDLRRLGQTAQQKEQN